MEKRLIIAIVLSFVVLILYQMIFIKNKPQEQVQPQIELPAEKAPEKPQIEDNKVIKEELPATAQLYEPTSVQAEELVTVDTPLYQAVWSNRGASLRSWKLKNHMDDQKEWLELVSGRAADMGKFPFFLETEDEVLDRIVNDNLYVASASKVSLREGETGEIKFEYSDRNNVKIEKVFSFIGGKYDFDIRVNLWKDGRKVEQWIVWGPDIGNPVVQDKRQQFGGGRGVAVSVANRVYRIDERKYKPEANAFNFADWAAFEDNYMAAIFLTESQQGKALFVREPKGLSESEAKEKGIAYSYFLSVSAPVRAYIGPKEMDRLKEFGRGTKKLINFGFFGGIAEILLIAMKYIHRFIPNWGVAIILITLVVKIIFFPLTYSSTKSMAKMQELQPKIKALRAKYKKAKQDIGQRRQMNEEMMKLYKEHGINPAGGCLPLLIQIPVFWGFFRLLVVAIEFRHSPFLLWIKDLSVKDPYYVTPLLMGATQFISQKMTPTSADPTQARMMLIMPVIMTIFFMNFQSGLVLYWLTNNVLQIGQQYIMNRMMGKKKSESHGKRRKN